MISFADKAMRDQSLHEHSMPAWTLHECIYEAAANMLRPGMYPRNRRSRTCACQLGATAPGHSTLSAVTGRHYTTTYSPFTLHMAFPVEYISC